MGDQYEDGAGLLERHPALGYLLAAGAALAAAGIRLALAPTVGPHGPYLSFVLAVIVAARFAGRRAGLTATALSALSGCYFLMDPYRSFMIRESAAAANLLVFVGIGVIISLVIGPGRKTLLSSARRERILERQTQLIDLSHDAIITVDRNRVIRSWNTGAVEIYGWTKAEAVGKVVDELLQSKNHLPMDDIRQMLAREGRWDGELIHIGREGRQIVAESSHVLLHDEQNSPAGFLEINRDITERKKAEEALRESRAKLDAALASMNDAVFISDTKGRLVDFNDAFATFHRFESKDECSRIFAEWPEILDVFSPLGTLVPTDMWAVPRALRGERVTNAEYILRRKDTGERWVGSYSFSPIRDKGGVIVGSVVVARDITDLKQAAQSLQESEERFRTLANAIPQLCWMAKADGGIFWYNQRWYEYTGSTPEQTRGWGWQSVHDPEMLPKALDRWRGCLASGEPFDMIVPLRGADGVFRPYLTRVLPVHDQDGKITQWFGTGTDITEQRRAEEALRESESRLRTLGDNLPEGAIYRYDQDCHGEPRVEFISAGIELLTGVTAAEFMADVTAVTGSILPEDLDRMNAAIAVSREQLTQFEVEVRHKHRVTGELRWSLTRSTPSRRPDGSTVWDGIAIDITDRKRAEEALRQSEQRVRRRLESILSPDVEMGEIELADIIDVDAIQSLMNDFYELAHVTMAILDNKGKVLVGVGWQEICSRYHRLHPETLSNCIESDTCLTTGIAPGDSKLYMCKNNLCDVATPFVIGGRHLGNIFTGQFWLDDEPVNTELFSAQAARYGFDRENYLTALEAVPQTSRQTVDRTISFLRKFGEIVGKLGYANIKLARSLSELERTQEAMRHASEQRGLALQAANLGAWENCFETGEVRWDERCAELFGMPTAGQIDYGSAISRIHTDDRPAVEKALQQALTGVDGGVYHREFRVVWPDGSVHWVSSHGRAYFGGKDTQRRAIRFVGVHMDITDRKRAESEILQLNVALERRVDERTAELREANKELEAFSYSVSHDLRAPLRSVEGFAKILLRDYPGEVLDGTAADYMRRMSAATQRMGQLIADLLVLSRLTRQEMRRQRVNLSDISAVILAEYQNREPRREVKFQIVPGLVAHADPQLVRVALENLLGNAWKYTSKRANASIVFGAAGDQKTPAYFVQDNGAGFDMAYADQLFVPFQRLHRSEEFEGTGIGLATVQRVVRRHGGRVWAEAQPGEGAVFYFTLGES